MHGQGPNLFVSAGCGRLIFTEKLCNSLHRVEVNIGISIVTTHLVRHVTAQ